MKRKLGFGLIEMLVVVGAISALTAIGYPAIDKGFEKGRESNDITAMQSADSLITSAALSGKLIGGKPAKEYTRESPLYFDEGGNLVSAQPVGYGKGTAKSGGEVWSSCDDYEYDPSLDYTNAYIVCWYDSGTRVAHVHWSVGDASGGTPSTTAPTYPAFPTRPTTEPTEETKEQETRPVIPIPTDPTTSAHSHIYQYHEKWNTNWLDIDIFVGHRYYFEDKVYIATQSSTSDNAFLPSANGWAFVPLETPSGNSKDHPKVMFASTNVLKESIKKPNVGAGVLCYSNDPTVEGFQTLENFQVDFQVGDYFIDDTKNPCEIYVFKVTSSHYVSPAAVSQNGSDRNWVKLTPNCGCDDFSCSLTFAPPAAGLTEEERNKAIAPFFQIADTAPFLNH